MNSRETGQAWGKEEIRGLLVRDLVERYPTAMPVLAVFDIDTCCGGGRAVGEALTLHGAPVEEVLDTLTELVGAAQGTPAR